MSRARKFIEGPKVYDPLTAVAVVLGGDYIFMNGSPKHPGFMMGMHVSTVAFLARAGRLALAVKNPDHPEHNEGKHDA